MTSYICDCHTRTKHNDEHSADDGVRNGDEERPELAEHSHDNHDGGSCLYDTSAGHLQIKCVVDSNILNRFIVVLITISHPPTGACERLAKAIWSKRFYWKMMTS